MNLTILKVSGNIDESALKQLQGISPESAHASGWTSPYKTGDGLVAASPYGTLLRYSELKRSVSAAQVAAEVERVAAAYTADTGFVLYGPQLKQTQTAVKNELLMAQTPVLSHIHVLKYGPYVAISTVSPSKVSLVLYALERAGITVDERIHCHPTKLHNTALTGSVLDYKVGGVITLTGGDKVVTLKEFDIDDSKVQGLLTEGYSIVHVGYRGELANFEVRCGELVNAVLTKPTKTELSREWDEAPEHVSVLEFGATVASVILEFVEMCQDE